MTAWCWTYALYGVADERNYAIVCRQREGARRVRTDALGRGRGDQPGDGGSHKLDGTTSRGPVCAGMRGSLHACMRLALVGCAWMARIGEHGRDVIEPTPYLWEGGVVVVGSIAIMGCSRRINAAVGPGMRV